MAARLCLFLLMFLAGSRLSLETRRSLIVWNVGQGQWATVVDEDRCWHFDVGGEFAPWGEIQAACRLKLNLIVLSHWDWDHIGLIGRARGFLPNICLLMAPAAPDASPRKKHLLEGLASCGKPRLPFTFWQGSLKGNANESSRVVLWRDILMPGDSPRDQEKHWAHELRDVAATRILVLGHQGSATSTGSDLLRVLSRVRVAIASARMRRYGHPHARVVQDFARRGIPLLRTEEWGSIRLDLDY